MSRRKRNYFREDLNRLFIVLVAILILGFYFKFKDSIKEFGYIFMAFAIVLLVIVIFLFVFFTIKKRKKAFDFDNDDDILYRLKGMEPWRFEKEIANMFNRFGYNAKAVGKSHDGGIDVTAKKDGKKYFIQCKKYLTSKAGVDEVRAFYGVVSKHNADGGFFITTNEFTEAAIEEFKNDKKIKLIDKEELIKYFKKSLKK